MLCYLLEVMLTPENTPPDCPKELYELYFVFCCVWAFGGCLFQDQVSFPLFTKKAVWLTAQQRNKYSPIGNEYFKIAL